MYVLKEDTDIIIFEDDRTGIILDWEYGESRGGKMALLCYHYHIMIRTYQINSFKKNKMSYK